jgi:hypothetical protein
MIEIASPTLCELQQDSTSRTALASVAAEPHKFIGKDTSSQLSRSRSRSSRRSSLTKHHVLRAAVSKDQVADDYSDRAMSNQCIALVDQESCGTSIARVGVVQGSLGDAVAPPPFKQTNGQVRFMLSGGYYEPLQRLCKGSNFLHLKCNDDVLYAGEKLGARGGQSTVKQYFHGIFLGWSCSEWVMVN